MASDTVARVLRAAATHGEAPHVAPCPTPPGFKVVLRPVQQQALAWMLDRERRCFPSDYVRVTTPEGRALYYGRSAFHLERPSVGGFLIQEMGVGKSVEALALVLANPAPPGELKGVREAAAEARHLQGGQFGSQEVDHSARAADLSRRHHLVYAAPGFACARGAVAAGRLRRISVAQ
eukprot:5566124-Prymnesium_polylepis.1